VIKPKEKKPVFPTKKHPKEIRSCKPFLIQEQNHLKSLHLGILILFIGFTFTAQVFTQNNPPLGQNVAEQAAELTRNSQQTRDAVAKTQEIKK